jgi:Peptidase family M23
VLRSAFRNSLLIAVLFVSLGARLLGAVDEFTPVLVTLPNPSTGAFLGTDGKQHVVYELLLTNANPTPATLEKLEVLGDDASGLVIATYEGKDLLSHMRTLGRTPVPGLEIGFGASRFFLLHLEFDKNAAVPRQLIHRLTLLGGGVPAPTPQTPVALHYTVAPLEVQTKAILIGPPLKGKGWVAFNGCCEVSGAHRASSQTVNGGLYFAQRFAIDWMRLDDKGRMLNGDDADVHSYADYGADVIAVADGKVVSTMKELTDQKPGTLPDISTINLGNVDGNHVVLDLGDGVFAFYAHLQHDSTVVSPGDHVKRGQVLGKLGNTGNTSAPHLHFHLMNSPSTLGSNGLAYVIDSFEYAGQVSATKFGDGETLEGSWNEGVLSTPSLRKKEFPMDFAIVDFPDR